MRLRELKARSFLAFQDEVSLDVEALGPGLIAIVGPNGAGKSTLLEGLFTALYRTSPSRKSALTDLVHGSRDATLEAAFSNGRDYRARVLIDGHTRRQEAYLYRDGEPVTSGKCPEYDAAVRDLFGPPELWLSSALASQRHAGDFLRAPKAQRKAIFAELLGLGELQRHHETAKERARDLEAQVAAKAEQLRDLDARLERRVEAQDRQSRLREEEAQARTALAGAEEHLEEARRGLAAVEAEKAAAAERSAQAAQLRAEIARLQGERDAAVRRAGEREAELRRRIAAQERLLADGDAIRQAVADAEDLENEIDGKRADLKVAQSRLEECRKALSGLRRAVSEVGAARERLAALSRDAETLKRVPCDSNAEPWSGCGFLTRAHEAAKESSAVRSKVARLEDEADGAAGLEDQERGLAESCSGLASAIDGLRAQLSTALKMAARASDLDTAEDRLRELQDDLAQVQGDTTDALDRYDQQLGDKRDALEGMDLPFPGDLENQLAEAAKENVLAQNAVRRIRQDLDRLTSELGAVRAELEALARDTARRGSIAAELDEARREAGDWNHLAKAFGKDGIQALEIGNAGPEVARITNDLLAGCYGTRFTVAFETLAPKRDGGQKEVFDVRILDDGQERLAEDLSGGEEVVLREAISLAIAIFHGQKAGARFETLFRDETAGALDPDHARRYVQMLRRAMEVGGFHQLVFVSHSPEVWEQADARVFVQDGAVRVEAAA